MNPVLTRPPGAPAGDPAPAPRPTLRRVGRAPTADPGGDPRSADQPTPAPVAAYPGPRPGAREAATLVLRLACEVLDGRRPPTHLSTHVDGSVVRYWRAVAERRRPAPGRPTAPPGRARFTRMRLCHPHPGAAEVAVAVEVDGGVRALAARFDHHDGRWRCTAMRLC
jgi:hypothetical protein